MSKQIAMAGPESRIGAEMILVERQRQVEREGWMPKHDDDHEYGEMTQAAVAYAIFAAWQVDSGDVTREQVEAQSFDDWWPWEAAYWKPDEEDPVRNLERAGALIAAEIDRLLRLGATNPSDTPEWVGTDDDPWKVTPDDV